MQNVNLSPFEINIEMMTAIIPHRRITFPALDNKKRISFIDTCLFIPVCAKREHHRIIYRNKREKHQYLMTSNQQTSTLFMNHGKDRYALIPANEWIFGYPRVCSFCDWAHHRSLWIFSNLLIIPVQVKMLPLVSVRCGCAGKRCFLALRPLIRLWQRLVVWIEA